MLYELCQVGQVVLTGFAWDEVSLVGMEDFLFFYFLSKFLEMAEFEKFSDGWGDSYSPHLSKFWEWAVLGIFAERNDFSLFKILWDSERVSPSVELHQDFLFYSFPEYLIVESQVFELIETNGLMSGQL